MSGEANFYSILGCEGRHSIEPSIHTLKIDGEMLVLDVGYMSTGQRRNAANEQQRMLFALEQLEGLKPTPTAILVSHAHLDYIGLLAHVYYLLENVHIFMTEFTWRLAKIMLNDAAKVSPGFYGHKLYALYEQATGAKASAETIIDEMLNSERIHICSFDGKDSEVQIGGTRVKVLRAGHIPGAASFLLLGQKGTTALYTGDYSRSDFLTVKAAPDPPEEWESLDVMITEATYGEQSQPQQPRDNEIASFVTQIQQVLAKGGRILIPAFALGKAQEVLAILLKKMLEENALQEYPIRVLGMARNVTYLCGEDQRSIYVTPWAFENFAKLFKHYAYAGYSQSLVRFPGSNHEVENALIYDNGPSIFIAPSGMLTGGWSPKVAAYLARESSAAILFVGFMDEESPGRRYLNMLKSQKPDRTMRLEIEQGKPPKQVPVSCLIDEYKLSAHANGREIEDYVIKWRPKNVLLVHGPTQRAKQNLQNAIKQKQTKCNILIPKNRTKYNVQTIQSRPSEHISTAEPA